MKTTLRRLLQFACLSCVAVQIAAQDTLPATDPTNAVAIEIESADDAPTNEPDAREDVDETEWRHSQSPRKGPIVAIGRTAELRANESAESVVAIMGSAHSAGRVRDAVVAVLGDAIVSGEVGETVVAVMGNVQLDGEVRDAVVAVMGNVTLGSNAVVRKDVVAVGGRIQMAEGARIHGQMQELDFHIPGLPRFDALSEWIRECVLK